jgi:hypothetical protein
MAHLIPQYLNYKKKKIHTLQNKDRYRTSGSGQVKKNTCA